jgi:hypothetical protein
MATLNLSCNDPYSQVISQFLSREFPVAFNMQEEDLVSMITNILIGNKDVRYGALNTPESQVTIRDIIRNSIETTSPIKVLIPWGSIKGDLSSNIDIAEVMAISRISTLAQCVKKYYSPGLEIVLRIEDWSGIQLFDESLNSLPIITNLTEYCQNLLKLLEILKDENVSITGMLEGTLGNAAVFHATVDSIIPTMERYLLETEDFEDISLATVSELQSFKSLQRIDWNGVVSREQREYYYATYEKLYNSTRKECIHKLALYLSQSLTRGMLNMRSPEHFDKFIQINFCPPVPGIPKGYDRHCVYYRTVPMSQARTHICPWRAKGYLQIKGDKAVAKLASFSHIKDLEIYQAKTVLKKGELSLTISSDYTLID